MCIIAYDDAMQHAWHYIFITIIVEVILLVVAIRTTSYASSLLLYVVRTCSTTVCTHVLVRS